MDSDSENSDVEMDLMGLNPVETTSDRKPPSVHNGRPVARRPKRETERETPEDNVQQDRMNEEVVEALELEIEDDKKKVIWGTTVVVEETLKKVRNFFLEFENPALPGIPLYPKLLEQIKETQTNNLNLDCQNIFIWDQQLYYQIVRYPQELIPMLDLVANKLFEEIVVRGKEDEEENVEMLQVRLFNLNEKKRLRDLNPSDVDQLVCIKGMVTRVSPVIPEIKQAHFSCTICQAGQIENVDRGRICEPASCPECKLKGSLTIIHNLSTFTDKQLIKLQETPDSIPEGEMPQTVSLCVFDRLVDVSRPGDKIEISGIYRACPLKVTSTQRVLKSVYRTYIDVIHIKKGSDRRMQADEPETEDEFHRNFEESDGLANENLEKEQRLRELARTPDIYEKLTRSLAPSIWGLDDVKKGLLCQLFGGASKKFVNSYGKFRGEINVLLVGDPGTSKSQMLQYVHKIAPRGVYTSGKGSSAVGLTAYITKDPDTRQTVLESGALVLSDRGVCCIDEFDKMSDQTRSILHEVMEQQTVSVAKAGIICTLNARTSVLASANPLESRYNPKLSVVENIQLPPTLLSRFDLIYLVLDKPNEVSDKKLAKHITALFYATDKTKENDLIDIKTLTEYITFARKTINPVISQEAAEKLVDGYVAMRRLGGNKRTITATPRQLESLVRLSEAHARIRFSKVVEVEDVQEAQRLVRVALQQAAIDPNTGTIDMDLITTGRSASSRGRLAHLIVAIKSYLAETSLAAIKMDQLIESLKSMSSVDVPKNEVREALLLMEEEESIILTGDPRNPTVRKM